MEQKRKTRLAAPAIAGAMAGSITVRKTRTGPAPSIRAASAERGSRPAHIVPTVRTTTEKLKNAIAATTAVSVPSSSRKE